MLTYERRERLVEKLWKYIDNYQTYGNSREFILYFNPMESWIVLGSISHIRLKKFFKILAQTICV